MPGCLTVDQARKDMDLHNALNPIHQSLSQLRKLVSDTQTVVGSEAHAADWLAYSWAKAPGKDRGSTIPCTTCRAPSTGLAISLPNLKGRLIPKARRRFDRPTLSRLKRWSA